MMILILFWNLAFADNTELLKKCSQLPKPIWPCPFVTPTPSPTPTGNPQ